MHLAQPLYVNSLGTLTRSAKVFLVVSHADGTQADLDVQSLSSRPGLEVMGSCHCMKCNSNAQSQQIQSKAGDSMVVRWL